MTPSKNSSFQICTICKLWHLQCGHIRFLNVLFLKHTFRKCLLTKHVLKKQIMLHIRRALCTFSDGLCICRVWPIILPQPPLKPQVHYLRQQTLIIHGYNWQIPAMKTIPQRRATETPITTIAADVTQLIRIEFFQNVYFICHFICLPRPPPLSTADSQSTHY